LPAASIHAGRLVRSPRAASAWSPADLTPPDAAPRRDDAPGGLVPAMLGLAGAGLIALLLRQPMFLLFGALGGLVAVGSWVAQRLAARRRRRRDRADQASAAAAFVAALDADRCNFLRHHVATVPTIAAARRTLLDRTDSLWSRRAAHHDAYVVSLGTGEQPWRTMPGRVAYCADEMVTVSDLPVPADLGPGARLAVAGPLADAVARALLMQLVASCGPADLRIVVITGRPAVWDCVRGLPHVTLPDGTVSVVDEHELGEVLEQLAPAESAHVLLVTDSHSALATRTSQLRRALGTDGTPGQRFGLLAVLPSDVGVPHMCSSVLTLGNGPTARWVADSTTTLLPIPVRIAGLGERATFQCSAAQHDLQDPEDPLAAARRMPRSLAIGALLGAEGGLPCAEDILRAWQAQGADPAPHTALGMAADGIVDIDLVRDGPHGLIAGTTGAGKSELLRTLVVGMAAAAAPTHLTFVLVDYKGGATFDACKKLPHVVGLVTDLDDHLADRALRSLHAELRRREAILRDHGAADLSALRAAAPAVMLPRLVVVIDEFAALVSEQPSFLHALVGVAQRGRSLGVHLLLATQRPHGVISDDIRANTNLRLALRLHDVADAIDVVGERTPAQLPRGVPGRAVMRLGPDDHVTFQTAHCTVTDPEHDETELVRLVREIVDAAARWGAPDPPAPWQPPLTEVLSRDDVPVDAIGVCDDPDRQRTVPLRWEPGDGSIVVAGSSGSGVTATLHTLAAHSLTVDRLGEPAPHVYVLDSG
jgi:S-DNA-T family DNA segregation ATPase FtsK/SpoIIIE